MNSKGKLSYLEGMRALMALNVILCHFVCVYYPQMYFTGEQYSGALTMFATTPLSALVNGNIAVVFFFALTGFLVGRSVFLKGDGFRVLPGKSINRYLRLLPTVAVATIFTFLAMKLGLMNHLKLTNENINTGFLSGYCNFDPTIGNLLLNMFVAPFVRKSQYIGPFWTIKYEFFGYILVLAVAILLRKSKWRRFGYLLVTALLGVIRGDAYFPIFIFGLIVADLEFNENPTVCGKLYSKLLTNKVFITVCFFAATYFACCPIYGNSPLYAFLLKIPMLGSTLLRGFGMALFIWVSLKSRIIQKILSWKPLVFLGEMSFETYAIHWPLMLTCEAGLFLVFEKYLPYHTAALAAFAITLVVIYTCSYLFSLLTKQINRGICALQNKLFKRA